MNFIHISKWFQIINISTLKKVRKILKNQSSKKMLKIILKMYFCYFPWSLEILGDTRMSQWKINISYKRENYVFVCSKIIVGKINFAPSFLSLHPYIPDRYYKFVKDNFMKPLCLCLCLFIGLFWKQMRPQKPLGRLYKPSQESLLLRKPYRFSG